MEIVSAYLSFGGIALLLGMVTVLAFGGALQLGRIAPQGYLVYFVVPLIVAVGVQTLSSGRNLSGIASFDLLEAAESVGWAKWVQRLATLFFLAAAAERLVNLSFGKSGSAKHPLLLMVSFAMCWLGIVGLPAALGTRPTISHEYFYSLVIGLAALATSERGANLAIVVTRNALMFFLVSSLLVLVIRRDMVLGPYVGGLIPAFPFRYSGLAVGPNALGPLCVLALLTMHARPFGQRWLHWLMVAVVLVSLLLTQSKSSWVAGLVCWPAMALVGLRGMPRDWLNEPRNRSNARVWLVFVLIGVLALLVAVVAEVGAGRLERFLSTRAGADLLTLTGRDEIWDAALDTFQRNPWFGYGPAIWDPYFRYTIGIASAFHAHNQFINVLAASGVAGAVAFGFYLAALVARLAPRIAAFRGLGLSLMLLMLIRSFTEVPFYFYGFGGESITQMLLLMILAGAPETEREGSVRK